MINDDLIVHPFSLKQIVENLGKIESKTGKFGEPSNDMSPKEKQRLRELMGKFNEYGKSLRGDQALMETAKNLSEMAELAKRYAMNENNIDFIQKDTVNRDYKQVENITKQFQKMAKECVSHLMQLNALYEDAGNVFERYYEMENLNEAGGAPVEAPPEVEPGVEPGVAPLPGTVPTPRHPLEPDPGQAPRPKGQFGAPRGMGIKECGTCGCGDLNTKHNKTEEEADEYASGF